MKNTIKILLASLIFISLVAFTVKVNKRQPLTVLTIKPLSIVLPTIDLTVDLDLVVKDHYAFLDAIGFKESGNRYDIVNRFGYMGKYQFGKRTLRGLGFKITKEEFLTSPVIQEKAMTALLNQNKRSLRKYIRKYNNQIVHGVLVTESGLLAAAHLGGAGSVKKWFRTGKVRTDGNGVAITTYMIKFQGYNLILSNESK